MSSHFLFSHLKTPHREGLYTLQVFLQFAITFFSEIFSEFFDRCRQSLVDIHLRSSNFLRNFGLLRDSGFEGFEIIKSDAAKDAYKVVRPDKKVAIRLSDGERHFLSFLYFYSQVKGCNPDGTRKDKIVVIDDPVSSLDGNALFIISSIVREMIEICYNSCSHLISHVLLKTC